MILGNICSKDWANVPTLGSGFVHYMPEWEWDVKNGGGNICWRDWANVPKGFCLFLDKPLTINEKPHTTDHKPQTTNHGNVCWKDWTNVPTGFWNTSPWPYKIGPADRAQRLNPPYPV